MTPEKDRLNKLKKECKKFYEQLGTVNIVIQARVMEVQAAILEFADATEVGSGKHEAPMIIYRIKRIGTGS